MSVKKTWLKNLLSRTKTFKSKDGTISLCEYCSLQWPMCVSGAYIKFGKEYGQDNVIECSKFKEKEEVKNEL